MSSKRFYRVLVTRDTTESAVIPVASTDPQTAGGEAIELARQWEHRFEPNDNGSNLGAPYLGDPEEDVEEIGEACYQVMLARTGLIGADGPMSDRIAAARHAAESAFWSVIARHFPEASAGDFSVEATDVFGEACLDAVRTWVETNVPRAVSSV